MTRGRKPKPTRLKLLAGNPGHREPNDSEPQPTRCMPEPPDWMGEHALVEWNRIVPELDALGMLTRVDISALEGHCTNYGRAVAAEINLAIEGLTLFESGGTKKNPAATVAKECWGLVRSFVAEFGLSPAARSRLKVSKPPDQDEFDKFAG